MATLSISNSVNCFRSSQSQAAPSRQSICPCCGLEIGPFRDLGTKGCIRLLECPRCGLVFADRSIWQSPYRNKDYYDPSNQPITQYPLKPTETDRDRLALLTKRLARGKVIDFGGGLGQTAFAAVQAGFDVAVIEESAKAVSDGKRYHPEMTWIRSDQVPNDIGAGSVSGVTLFHVMEHVLEPGKLIDAFARIIRPNGYLLVEVPNWGSNLRRLHGLEWQYVLDHHVNYFTSRTLASLVTPRGFCLEKTVYRRTFCINEAQRWKEPFKSFLCWLGFGEIVRCLFRRSGRK